MSSGGSVSITSNRITLATPGGVPDISAACKISLCALINIAQAGGTAPALSAPNLCLVAGRCCSPGGIGSALHSITVCSNAGVQAHGFGGVFISDGAVPAALGLTTDTGNVVFTGGPSNCVCVTFHGSRQLSGHVPIEVGCFNFTANQGNVSLNNLCTAASSTSIHASTGSISCGGGITSTFSITLGAGCSVGTANTPVW